MRRGCQAGRRGEAARACARQRAERERGMNDAKIGRGVRCSSAIPCAFMLTSSALLAAASATTAPANSAAEEARPASASAAKYAIALVTRT